MQATLWKCLLRGSVQILVCYWSIFRLDCLEPKNLNDTVNAVFEKGGKQFSITTFHFLNDIKNNAVKQRLLILT